jgi:putative cardiolipin synthase
MERLETLFFALDQAGALRRVQRDRRGHALDRYQVEPEILRQVIHDATVARRVLQRVQAEHAGEVELVATLPDSLPLGSQSQQGILPLAAALHRLITEAGEEILILNPFFEQEGFDRWASALLSAASKGVTITIITRQLSDPTSVNRQVLGELNRQAISRGLRDHFLFWEYQEVADGRMVLVSHAKVLVSDGERAYLGSANLTEYGMSRFLEIGVLLRGALVGQLRQVFQAIRESDQAGAVPGAAADLVYQHRWASCPTRRCGITRGIGIDFYIPQITDIIEFR